MLGKTVFIIIKVIFKTKYKIIWMPIYCCAFYRRA